jgi:salicylate hydroxylase/6-hydroxynicotinate 3-monooxygenase
VAEREPSIAIIGAGLGGLAAALAFDRVGIRADVYEQAPAIAPVGAGIQLTPNASAAIRGLGILDEVRARSYAPSVGYNRDWDTGRVTNLQRMGREIEETYGAPDLAMHRAVLHGALLARVSVARVHLGRRLVGLDSSGPAYRLRFMNGTEVVADAVIGADGIHSVVRETLFGREDPCFNGRVAYRTTFPTARIPAGIEIDGRVKWWGPDRHVVSYLLTPQGDEVYYIAVVNEPDFRLESWSTSGSLDDVLRAFAGFHPRIRAVLGAAEQVRKWALVDRDPMPSWGEGRIVLLGDACHPMPPYIAQGAASAIEDAVVLSRCVAGFERSGRDRDGLAEAFRLYERVRRPRTSRMQVTARQNTWLRYKTDADWVYGYDAFATPLAPEPEEPTPTPSTELRRRPDGLASQSA